MYVATYIIYENFKMHVSKILCSEVIANGITTIIIRVESGLDDPDNLGHLSHFFGGSSGSHLQTKLSGCGPDITCSLKNSVDIW